MNRPSGKLEWIVWSGLLLVMLGILGAFLAAKFYAKPLEVFSRIPDFKLTDQNGKDVSLADLRGNVWVADVVFTRCPLQCMRMTKNMSALQDALPSDPAIKLVSITADPGYDKPAILKKYGEHFGAKENWLFLTGEKRTINRIAVDGMKLTVVENPPEKQENPDDLFIHSTKFVLIDDRGQVRGWFDGEEPESRPQLVAAVKQLLREKN